VCVLVVNNSSLSMVLWLLQLLLYVISTTNFHCCDAIRPSIAERRSGWSYKNDRVVGTSVSRCIGNISQAEYDGLQAIYDATNGPQWRLPVGDESSWVFPSTTADPCGASMWEGLLCGFGDTTGTCYVAAMELKKSNLVGTLPTELGLLAGLKNLSLSSNSIFGSIPTELGSLTDMMEINLSVNVMSSTIPSELGLCTNLLKIYLNANSLSGTIPLELFSLLRLQDLNLYVNQLQGTVPSQLQQLSHLKQLYLDSNLFYGTLPPELSRIPTLELLSVTSNSLSGTIPEEYFGMESILYLYLNFNKLSGTLSKSFKNLTTLVVVSVQENLFTGTITDSIFSLTALTDLYLPSNFFSGTLSPQFSNLARADLIALQFNLLTGLLPSALAAIDSLESLDIGSNYISGSLPTSWETSRLQSLTIGTNLISGSLPDALVNCQRLGNLNASFNLLTGPVNQLFSDETNLRHLLYFDASDNALSGSFPSEMFEVTSDLFRSLEVVVLYSNCFTGSLPDSICTAKNMTTLVLDSVGNAPACAYHFPRALSKIFKAIINVNNLAGGIPSCIFSMPKLQTLHLSGNGLTGSLQDLTNMANPVLNDVSLASNVLTGSIPQSWQDWPWTSLDLSANKLSGFLYSNAFSNSDGFVTLDLTVNRLSGQVPGSLYNATGVDVLNGNLFQCSQADKPKHDPDSDEYVCGSSDFNVAIIVWLVLGVCVGIGLAWVSYTRHFRTVYRHYCEAESLAALQHVNLEYMPSLRACLLSICRTQLCLTLLFIVISLLSYVIMKLTNLSDKYSTHSYQYAWVTTIAYLHGVLPFVLLCCYILAGSAIIVLLRSLRKKRKVGEFAIPTSKAVAAWSGVVVVLCIHMAAMTSVNVLYVFAVIRGLSKDVLVLVQFLLGTFKLSWNFMYVSRSLRWLYLSPSNELKLSSFMYLFTFVISPVVATFFTDSTCFRYLITGQPTVTSTFLTDEFGCNLVCADTCVIVCVFTDKFQYSVDTSVTPGWVYSYQCGSSLLVNYSSVLLFSFTISGILVPLCQIIHSRLTPPQAEKIIPKVVRDSVLAGTLYDHAYDPNSTAAEEKGVFQSFRLISKLCMNTGVLITFGLASPLLSLAVCVDSAFTFIMFITYVEKLLRVSDDVDDMSPNKKTSITTPTTTLLWAKLESAATGATDGVGSVFWMINVMSGVFWSLFVFDMIADVYGDIAGGLVVLVPTVGNWLFYWGFKFAVNRKRLRKAALREPFLLPTSSRSNPIINPHGDVNDAF
jgi:hypothetical protein